MGHSNKDTSTKTGHRHHGGSGHHRKRAEDSHRSGQDTESFPSGARGVPNSLGSNTLSFLFVVNNLVISENARIGADRYGIIPPPRYRNSYTAEIASPVFRYQEGRVTPLSQEQYAWFRGTSDDGSFASGRICGRSVDSLTNQSPWEMLPVYRTYTVFRGWHFQPVMFMGCDALTTDVDEVEVEMMYHPLSFAPQRRGETMVSLVTARSSLYAAGKHADWVGKLVPDCYRNPYSGTPHSGGLAGELSIILGLMGLSQPHLRAADAFTGGLWQDRRWRGPRWEFRSDPHDGPSPGPDDTPRGVLVQVCLDEMENRAYSTADALSVWEREGVIVREPSR